MITISDHIDELLTIINQANEAVIKVYHSHFAVEMKEDHTPLTAADKQAHQIITSGLALLSPDIPIVSEEGDKQRNRQNVLQPVFWLIDPLDGTKEFAKGPEHSTGEFTVCIALIVDGRPVFGMISAPALGGVTYYGGSAIGGSYKIDSDGNKMQIHVAEHDTGGILRSSRDVSKEAIAYYADHYPQFDFREAGVVGSQLKPLYIAEGNYDVFAFINGGDMKLWDLAAGEAILEAAGGKVTRPNGELIDYRDTSFLIGDFVARRV